MSMSLEQLLPRSQASQSPYAKNPLYEIDTGDVVRATLSEGMAGGLIRGGAGAAPAGHHRHEEALAPFLDSIRSHQGDPMYAAFSGQMNHLYQVFKDLYEQDQVEIRQLLIALETQKQQLTALAGENVAVRQQLAVAQRERSPGSAPAAAGGRSGGSAAGAAARVAATGTAAAATQTEPQSRPPVAEPPLPGTGPGLVPGPGPGQARLRAPPSRRFQRPTLAAPIAEEGVDGSGGSGTGSTRGDGGGGGGGAPRGPPRMSRLGGGGRDGWTASPAGSTTADRRGRGRSGGGVRPYLILFLPYMLHPAHHCWRFYAAWQHSWTTRRTLWLALAWLLVFLLAVGLLVGLLVPWGRLTKTRFEAGPEVVAVGAAQVSLLMQLNRNAEVYYVVVPEAYTTGSPSSSRRRQALTAAAPALPDTGGGAGGGRASGRGSGGGGAWARDWGPFWAPWSRSRRSLAASRRRMAASVGGGGGGAPPLLHLGSVETDDVAALAAEGDSGGPLFPYAVACGEVEVNPRHTNYTLTVRSVLGMHDTALARVMPAVNATAGGNGTANATAANATAATAATATAGGNGTAANLPDECVSSFGLALNGTLLPVGAGPFSRRRCQRCPLLLPGTPYVVLLVGDGGRRTGVVRVRFTTAQAPASPPPPPSSAAAVEAASRPPASQPPASNAG